MAMAELLLQAEWVMGSYPVLSVAVALVLCLVIKAWSALSASGTEGKLAMERLGAAWAAFQNVVFSGEETHEDPLTPTGDEAYLEHADDGEYFFEDLTDSSSYEVGQDEAANQQRSSSPRSSGLQGGSSPTREEEDDDDDDDDQDGLWLVRPLKERLALFVGTWSVGNGLLSSDRLAGLDSWLPVGFKHDFYVVGLQGSRSEVDCDSQAPQVNQSNPWFDHIEKLVDSDGWNFFRVIAISFFSLHLLVLARKEHRKRISDLTFSVYPSIDNALQMAKDSLPRAIGIAFKVGDTSLCFLYTFFPRGDYPRSPSISPSCSPLRSPSSRRESQTDREHWEKAKEAEIETQNDSKHQDERRSSGRRLSNSQFTQLQADKFKTLLANMRLKNKDREIICSFDYLFVLGNPTTGPGNHILFSGEDIHLPFSQSLDYPRQVWDTRILYSCLPGCPIEHIEYSSSFDAGLYPPVSCLFSIEYLLTQRVSKKDKFAELVFTSLQIKGLPAQDSRGLANPYIAFFAPFIEEGIPSTSVAYQTVDPIWHKNEIPIIRTRVVGRDWLRYIQLAVYSRNAVLEDELMGQGVIPLRLPNGFTSIPFCIPLIAKGEVDENIVMDRRGEGWYSFSFAMWCWS